PAPPLTGRTEADPPPLTRRPAPTLTGRTEAARPTRAPARVGPGDRRRRAGGRARDPFPNRGSFPGSGKLRRAGGPRTDAARRHLRTAEQDLPKVSDVVVRL